MSKDFVNPFEGPTREAMNAAASAAKKHDEAMQRLARSNELWTQPISKPARDLSEADQHILMVMLAESLGQSHRLR